MSIPTSTPSVRQAILARKHQHQLAVVPFIPAGYPNLDTTAQLLLALDSAGAAVIEVGFPFSDPIADGPIIQEAFTAALANKIRVSDIFAAVASAAPMLRTPLVAMISYSIVYRYGSARFFEDARRAGFAGIILPDLPPPEAQTICAQIASAGIESILLIAPTTPLDRRRLIASLCTGFIYYLSVSGITGERDSLPADLAPSVDKIRTLTDTPICVGFGLHSPAQMQQLSSIADGGIVGSAIVRRIKQAIGSPPSAIAANLKEYVQTLTRVAL